MSGMGTSGDTKGLDGVDACPATGTMLGYLRVSRCVWYGMVERVQYEGIRVWVFSKDGQLYWFVLCKWKYDAVMILCIAMVQYGSGRSGFV
jgi:hypothetical protein